MCSIDKMVGGGLHDLRRSFLLPGLQCVLCKTGDLNKMFPKACSSIKYEGQAEKKEIWAGEMA